MSDIVKKWFSWEYRAKIWNVFLYFVIQIIFIMDYVFFPTICISTQAWTHDSGKCSCDQLSFTKHVRYCSAWMIMRHGINTFLPVRQHSALCHVSLWHVSLLCFVLFFFSLRLLFTHLRAWNEDFCDADISKKLRVPSHGSYHKPFLWSVKSQMLREGPVIYWLMSWKF